jgi:putative phosphoesterase
LKLGIVSDIHCQHRALERALDASGPIDRLICAGDAIDQTRFCERTIAILGDRDALAIQGNHEVQFFGGSGGPGLSADHTLREWLALRPREVRLTLEGRRLHLVHATSWSGDFPYVPPNHRDFGRFGESDADIVIYGHTHTPVIRRIGGVLVINPGSVGEGRPEPTGFVRSCALLDLATGEARIIDLD